MNDNELLQATRQGDRRAFDQLFAKYYRRLVGFATRLTGDQSSAEEIAQEAFVKVLQHLDQEFAGQQFASWLFKVARNLALNHRRAQSRLRLVEQPDTGQMVEPRDELLTHDHRLEQREWASIGLARLNEDQREVFLLRAREGLSYAEIADIIGRPIGTVRSRLHHAVQALRNYAKESAT